MQNQGINIRNEVWKQSTTMPSKNFASEQIKGGFFTEIKDALFGSRISSVQEIIIAACLVSAIVTMILLLLKPPMICEYKKNDWQEAKPSFIKILVYVLLATIVTVAVLIVKNYI